MFGKITSMCTIAEDTTHCSDQFVSGGFRRFDHGSCCPVCDILLTKMELSKIVSSGLQKGMTHITSLFRIFWDPRQSFYLPPDLVLR